jgi:hypothetical protein
MRHVAMQPSPDVIVIKVRHEEDLVAERAELLVTVTGSSLVTGGSALRKAKEVSDLVAELERCGINPEDVSLEGVHAEVSSGMLGKSSSATYRLRIWCKDLERLPDALGAITSARNSTLGQVIWRYRDSPEQQLEWLQRCIALANLKAQAAASALGARIVGIHRLTEQGLMKYREHRIMPPGGYATRARSAPMELGFDLTHRRRGGLKVTVEYLVEGFHPPS